MPIRSAAKAVIVRDGCILLNRCFAEGYGTYYDMPGGGQNQGESLEQAIIRECLEETGYTVQVGSFLALSEEIFLNPLLRERYPNHVHRVYHAFLCDIREDVPRIEPTEIDYDAVELEWVALSRLPEIRIMPQLMQNALPDLLSGNAPQFLGTEYTD